MWIFALLIVLYVLVMVVVATGGTRKHDVSERLYAAIMVTIFMGLFSFLCGPPIAKATGGMIPDYGTGVREGYLTKISKKGVLYKTWEAEMQIGSGELSAIQAPFAFSIADDDLAKKVRENLSKKVTLEYRQWVFMPYSVGDSGYEAKEITLHPADKK